MIAFRNITTCMCRRKFSSRAKLKVIPSSEVLCDIEKEIYKPRNHPGVVKPRTVTLPQEFIEAVENTLEDHPAKGLVLESQKLVRHLHGRVPPMEGDEVKNLRHRLIERVLLKEGDVQITCDKDQEQFKQKVNDKVKRLMQEKVYNWSPMDYDQYKSLLYLIGRSPAEYSALVKILSELKSRDTNFLPRSLFDFGSGTGTVTWAARLLWPKSIYEYFNVDSSPEMNDLAQILLKGGRGTGPDPKGVYYRQFLPANNTTYDLVISAYSLMELPSFASRIETVLRLWNKTEKYLIIVENGTNAGFKIINEIRDFILQTESQTNIGHIFSPCPHDMVCPRFLESDNTPCNFQVSYYTMPIGANVELKRELYSYVVLKKGARDPNDAQWPRVVRETLIRSKHTICRLCCANAKLEEIIFTASKHGKTTYHCARSTKWGDLVPVAIEDNAEDC